MAPKPPNSKLKKKEEKERLKRELELEKIRLEQERLVNLAIKEQRNATLRKIMLESTQKASDAVQRKASEFKKTNEELAIWERYLDPRQPPSAASPPDLRKFLTKWKTFDDLNHKNSYDIRLNIDERSILTQNINSIEKTFSKVISERAPIGDKYKDRITEAAGIIEDLNEVVLSKQMKTRIHEDLQGLQLVMRKALHDYIDKWSFEVLLHIDTDMNDLNSITADYFYDSDVVKQFIWCFKEVPLPPNYVTYKQITMKNLNCEFTNSTEVDLGDKAALRGLWMSYDHFSDLCPMFFPPKSKAQSDLRKIVQYETDLAEELKEKKLNEMRKIRADYEEKIAKKLEMDQKIPEKGKKPEKKKKKKKKEKEQPEPPIVTEDTVVDISDELERELLQTFHASKIFDDSTKIENEVNLRQYSVLGGTYEINLLQRPKQSITFDDNMILRLVELPDFLRYKEFHSTYEEIPKPVQVEETEPEQENPNPMFRQKRRSSVVKREEELARWQVETELNQKKMIEIKIKLPDHVYWWKPPKVCRWEPWAESEEFANLSAEMKYFNLHQDEIMEKEQEKLFGAPEFKPSFKNVKRVLDFKFNQKPMTTIDSHTLIKYYLLPRMPDDYEFYPERMEKETKVRQVQEEIERRKMWLREEEKRKQKTERESMRRSWKERESLALMQNLERQNIEKVEEKKTKTKSSKYELKEVEKKEGRTSKLKSKENVETVSELEVETKTSQTSKKSKDELGTEQRKSQTSRKSNDELGTEQTKSQASKMEVETKSSQTLKKSNDGLEVEEEKTSMEGSQKTSLEEEETASQISKEKVTESQTLTTSKEELEVEGEKTASQASVENLEESQGSKTEEEKAVSRRSSQQSKTSLDRNDEEKRISETSSIQKKSSETSMKGENSRTSKLSTEVEEEIQEDQKTEELIEADEETLTHKKKPWAIEFTILDSQTTSLNTTKSEHSIKSEQTIVVETIPIAQTVVEKTPPRRLFPKELKARPLDIVRSTESVQHGPVNEDTAKLSEFVAYLDILNDQEKPLFHTDSYIDRQLEEIEARRLARLEESKKRESKQTSETRKASFYAVPRRSYASISRSRILSITPKDSKDSKSKDSKAKDSKTKDSKRKKIKESKKKGKNKKEEKIAPQARRRSSDLMLQTTKSSAQTVAPIVEEDIQTEPEILTVIPHPLGRWSNRNVYSSFHEETRTLTLRSCSFGSFGLLTEKYLHFPLKKWEISPQPEHVEVSLTTQYTRVILEVSLEGYKVGIYVKTKSFMEELVPVIDQFVPLKVLMKTLQQINMNIFPEPDASTYIAPNCIKLDALEDHSIKCFSFFCCTHQFQSLLWNEFATYRQLIMKSQHLVHPAPEEWKEILLTPHHAEFVCATEDCAKDSNDKVKLRFTANPPHQTFNADLRGLLMAQLTMSTKKQFDGTNPILQWNVYQLLRAVKIFSYTVAGSLNK